MATTSIFNTNVTNDIMPTFMTSYRRNTTSAPNVTSQIAVPEGCKLVRHMDLVPWDNPQSLTSRAAQQTMDDLLKGVTLPVCFVICAPTNILNMAVFYKQGLKERINLCLFFLALSDLLVVTGYFCFGSGTWLAKLTGNPALKMEVFKLFINNHLLVFSGFIYVSSFLSTLIACERCFCVLCPLRSHTMLETRTMGVLVFLGHAIILGIFSVAGLSFSVVCVYDPVTNTTLDLLSAGEFRANNENLVGIFEGYVAGLALPGFSLAGVTIATIVTLVQLRKMSNWRKQSTSSAAAMSTRDVALTRMLVMTGIVFIVCTFPGVVCHTAAVLVPGMTPGGLYHNTYLFMISVQLLFVYINSSVNFFVYYKTGTRFRNTLMGLCGSRRAKIKTPKVDRSVSMNTGAMIELSNDEE